MNKNRTFELEKSGKNITPKKTSRWATCSLISAVIAIMSVAFYFPMMFVFIPGRSAEEFFILTAVLFSHIAMLLGIVAIIVIAFNRNKLKGSWRALLAILLSTPFIIVMATGIFVARGRAEGHKIANGQRISMAILNYANDHNGYLPDANQWCDLLIEYDKKLTKENFSYDSSKAGVCNYAFNQNLSNLPLDDIPRNTVFIFESKGGWNLSGTKALFAKTPPKRQYVYVYDHEELFPAIHPSDAAYKHIRWIPP